MLHGRLTPLNTASDKMERQGNVTNVILAFTAEQVHKLTGLSVRQIRYWDDTDFFSPSYAAEKRRPFGRVYSIQDVVWLRTVALLNKKYKISLRKLRPIGKWLKSHPTESWATLQFWIGGGELFFEDHEVKAYLAAGNLQQTVIPIEMRPIIQQVESDADRLRHRTPDEIGEIVQKRSVSHNKPVLAGTRIRTEAIWNFHEAGYSDAEILSQYPRLCPVDITKALEFERERRTVRRRAS